MCPSGGGDVEARVSKQYLQIIMLLSHITNSKALVTSHSQRMKQETQTNTHRGTYRDASGSIRRYSAQAAS